MTNNKQITSSDDYPAPNFHYGNPESSNSFELSGKIMLSSIVILFCVVVIMAALHFYARWYLLRARRRQILRRRSRLNEARSRATHIVFYADDPTTVIVSDPGNRGLDSSVLRSLPVFLYSPKTQPEPLDCAVCLSDFENNETGRVLPKCNHAFHIECIDMWFQSHSTCPLCRAPVEPVPEPAINCSGLSQVERTGVESAGSSSSVCVACYHEEGNSSTTSSGPNRKGLDVIIEVPVRNGLESEFTLSSPVSGGGFKSPGARLFSEKMKRMLSIGGRKTPTGECSTAPSGAATSCHTAELDLEQGPSELTPSQTPR